jgi:hypothetical protein
MAVLAGACLLTRIALWPSMITNPDGAECAFALDQFNVAAGHPHPPGYLLFVYSAKVFYRLGLGANHSLLLTSTLFSALACALLYALGTLLFGRRVGLAAAVLLLVDNNFWRMGLGHISSVTAPCWGIAIALACWRAGQRPGWRQVLLSAAVIGVAGGYRQEFLFLALPLWLWCCRRAGAARLGAGLALLVGLGGLWLGVTCALSGGYAAYGAASGALWRDLIYGESALAAFTHGPHAGLEALLAHLGGWADLTFGGRSHLSVLPWLLLGVYAWGRVLRLDLLRRDLRPQILVLWVVPFFLFHVLLHMFARAHATVYAPVTSLLAGLGVVLLAEDWVRGRPGRPAGAPAETLGTFAVALTLAALLSTGAFLIGTLPGERQDVADLRARLAWIHDFPPSQTVLIASDEFGDFPTVQYYTRDYRSFLLGRLAGDTGARAPNPLPLAPSVRQVIFLGPRARVLGATRALPGPTGPCLLLHERAPGEQALLLGPEGVSFTGEGGQK